MNNFEQIALEETDLSDICVTEVMCEGGISSPAGWKYLMRAESIQDGMKISRAKCGQCAVFLSGQESVLGADCTTA